MTRRDHNVAAPLQTRHLRPDAWRYIRPDALRFIRPDVTRILAPAMTAAGAPEMDLKFRADQRRIPAGQPGGGRWADMLAALIWGLPSAANSEEDEDDGASEDGGDERTPSNGAATSFRNAYAQAEEISPVEHVDTSPRPGSLSGESEGVELQTEVAPSKPGDAELIDPTDPLPIVPVAQRSRTFTDKYGDPYYSPGGHHEMPQSIFQKWDLQPETRRVFNDGTTGPVPRDTFRTSPDGVPQGHFWDGPNGAHAKYNDAVRELTDRFMNDRGISPSQMTPDQAWELLGEIRESADPRIRGYNDSVRLLRRLKLLRTGRGSQ